MSFQDDNLSKCEKCGKEYTEMDYKWCKPCQIDNLKKNLLIELVEMKKLKQIGKGGFVTHLAIWKDGPLKYNFYSKKEYQRFDSQKIALKCLHDSQNTTDEFLNEVKVYLIKDIDNILQIYGISQNPDTKDY
ncbi:hypothetical protein C1645_825839 [Glomus cerebriforme]|uniref:Protein kinase domain-containing protein n=1 Tax=Glomus cerebriforme TaxID=658196 RepID=A0A397SRF5_9GLOM|nr:hypothetical protein C1645_825839 [Glomus cerebriforme]